MQNDSYVTIPIMRNAGFTMDLFGNEHPAAGSQGASVQLNVFDHAAEREAIASGRPVSQERTEIISPATRKGSCIGACGRDTDKGAKLCKSCAESARARILAKARGAQ